MIHLRRINSIFRHSLTRPAPKLISSAFKHANSLNLSPLISANSIVSPSLTIRNHYVCSTVKELSQEDAEYLQKLDKQAQFYFQVHDYEQARRVLMPMADFLLKKGQSSKYAITLSKIASSYRYQYKMIDSVNYFQKAIKFLDGLQGNFYSQKSLIKIEYAETLIAQKNYDRAEEYLNECVEYLKQSAHMLEQSNALALLAKINQQKQKYEDAIRLLSTQLNFLQKSFKIKGKVATIFSGSLIQLSICYQKTGNFKNALKKSLQAKSILQAEGLHNQSPFAFFLIKLGQIHKFLNQIEQSFDCYEKAIAILERNSDEKAFVMNGKNMAKLLILKHRFELGIEYLKAEKPDKALHHMQRIVQMHKSFQGDLKDNDLRTSLLVVAEIHQSKQNWAEASKYYEQFLDIHKIRPLEDAKIQVTKSNEVISALNKLAQCYTNLGKFSEALILYQRVKSIFEALGRAKSLEYALNLMNTANIYKAMNKMQQFFQCYSEGLNIMESKNGKDHPSLPHFLQTIGLQYYKSGHQSQALPFLQRCYSILSSSKQKDNKILNIGSLLYVIGNIHNNQQNYTQALKHHRQALEIFQKHQDQNDQDIATNIAGVLIDMAETYKNIGDFSSSLHYALNCLEIVEKFNGKKNVENVNIYIAIAYAYRQMGNLAESEKYSDLVKELQQKQEK